MATLTELPMAKATPPPGESPGPDPDKSGETKHLRIDPELLEKIVWICRATGQKAAQYVGPILRPTVELDYAEYSETISQMKLAAAKAKKRKSSSGS